MADPKIRYDIAAGVSGQGDVKQLETAVRELGDSLEGDLKVQAKDAADALAALGAKQGAVTAFKQISNESQSLVIELAEATTAVNRLAQELPQAAAATTRFATAEAAARTVVDGAKRDLDEQRLALAKLRDEFTGSARKTDAYRESNAQLQVTVKSLRQYLKEKGDALKTAEQSTATAAQAEKKLATEYNNAGAAAIGMRSAVTANARALDDARNSLVQLGVGTANLTQSERNLEAAIVQVRERVQSLAPAFAAAAASSSGSVGRQVADQRTLKESVRTVGDELRKIQSIAVLAFTGGMIGSAIKDVAATADEFRNLEARIRLASSEGAEFESAMSGVAAIALRTNSALSETGTLFTRLAKTGRDAGLSSMDAQLQALSLTETINQAIQLSGGSADASKAAITQLIQGLQSGVLRGEEFNSVMEQAPRLAQALAQGLGRTTGELRKMANQGELTSQTVITALTKQSSVVAAEFEKLPLTIGRSLQNLSTQWTLYVGASDNGMASSANVAKIIDGLAKNLDTLVSVLFAAGKAWAAIKIAGLAVDVYKWAAASAAATVAVQANTVAVGVNTAAHVANAAAQGASAAAGAAAGVSGAKAADGVSKAGAAVSKLGGLFLRMNVYIAALVNSPAMGRWLGEATAKWVSGGDAVEAYNRKLKDNEEATLRNAEALRQQNIVIQEARDKQFQLSKDAQGLIGQFDQMRIKGDGAADAIGKIGKDFDLGSVEGIKNAGAVLDKLVSDGKISSEQFKAAWADALSGKDLGVFEVQARAAFAGATREAERLAAMLDGTAREAIKRTGLEYALLAGSVGAASRSALNDTEAIISSLERLKEEGLDTSLALTASLGRGIDTADSQKAIAAVRGQIELVRKELGTKIADGLLQQAEAKAEELRLQLDQLKPGIQGAAEAMRYFGMQSAEALKRTSDSSREAYDTLRGSGLASAQQLREAFVRTANDAIAANNGIAPSWLIVEAGIRGVILKTDEFGKSTVETMRKAGDAWGSYGDTVQKTAANAEAALGRLLEQQDRAARQANFVKGTTNAGQIGPDNKVGYKSATGNTREERLAGQNAVDNTLQFALLEKLKSGALETSDIGALKTVIQTLKTQIEVNNSARAIGGGMLSNEGRADAFQWSIAMGQFEQAVRSLESKDRRGVASTKHTVTLKSSGMRDTTIGVESEADARALVQTMTAFAKRAA